MPQNSFWAFICCRSTPVEELPQIPVHQITAGFEGHPAKLEIRTPALTYDSISIAPTPVSQASAAGVGFIRSAVLSPVDSPSSIKLVVPTTPPALDPELCGRTITSRQDNLTITPEGKVLDLTPPKVITRLSFSPPKVALDTIVDVDEDEDKEIVVTSFSHSAEVVTRGIPTDVFLPLATNRGELIEAHLARERGESAIIVGDRRFSHCDGEYKCENEAELVGELPGYVAGQ